MKSFKVLIRIITLISLLSISAFAVTLDIDDFNTSDTEGWSGGGGVVSGKYKISSPDTASKTFSFPAYANQAVTLTLTADSSGYDSGETYIITINGLTVANQSADATLTFNGTLNSSGEMVVTIKSNASSTSEYVTVDNITLATGSDYSVDYFRDFKLASQYNIKGNMQIIGNSVMLNSGGVCPPIATNNNDLNPVWANLNTDGNASIYNSTSATLTLPAGVDSTKIKYAGLYWQGRVDNSNTFTAGKTILFKPEGIASYQSITSESYKFNWSIRSSDKNYQGVADVTSLIKQSIDMIPAATIVSSGYSGTIWAANVLAEQMSNGFGAWSLVIVYENSAETLKNLTVYDGYKEVTSSNTVPVTLSGFLTPNTAPVNSKFLIFGGEGDISLDDSVSLSNNVGTDVSLGSNVFNSSETNSSGSNITARDPSCQNTIGIDIHTYDIGTNGSPSIIGTGQTSTTVKLTSDGDVYYPGVFAFSTDLYEPDVCYVENIFKGTTNISGIGAQVSPDENLTVRVYIKNKGTEEATGVSVLHQFDSLFPYAVNSANYNNSNPAYEIIMPPLYTRTSATDSTGNDLYEYNTTSLLAKINLGTGATSSSGGTFNSNTTSAVFEYTATVKVLDSNYSNVYKAGYINGALGIDYTNNPVTIFSCDGSKNSFWGYAPPPALVGTMDVIEHSEYETAGSYAAADKNILTKVVNKQFALEAVYLDASGNEKVYNGAIGNNKTVNMAVMLYTTDTGSCSEQRQLIWDGELVHNSSHVDANVTGTASGTTKSYLLDKAVKDQRIKANFIDYGTLINAGTDLTCSSSSLDSSLCLVPACLNSNEQILKAFPVAQYPNVSTCLYGDGTGTNAPCDSDAYNGSCGGKKSNTIGPIKYNNDIGCAMCLADALGMNGCSTDNFAARPNEFNSSLTTGQQFQAGVSSAVAFYANQFGGSGTTDYNESEIASPPSFVVDLNISDSTKTCAQPSLHFDPRVEFSNGLVSGPYKITNIGDFNVTMHEINGSEFAFVDADDTNDALRLITPFTQQIKVIPHHFELDGNFTNRSNGFTYFSNFEEYNTSESRTISASLDFNITAQAVDNNTTSNYTELCYAKDGNVTMTLANALIINPVGSLTKMLWYDQNHDINGSIALAGTTYSMDMKATQFDSLDVNGTAQVKYLINFDRDQILVVDPITMTINQVVATDTDLVNGTKVLAANNSANYLYGRIIPRDIRVFGDNTPFTANAWYEVFNTPAIGITTLPISKNDTAWSTNTLHNDANDGDGNVTVVITGANPANAAAVNGVETYTFGAGYALGGYKAHILTNPWLWYGTSAVPYLDPANPANLDCLTHPCFNINVVPAVGATGSAKSTNTTTKASKRSTEGGGTWKSTKDYAPAIR